MTITWTSSGMIPECITRNSTTRYKPKKKKNQTTTTKNENALIIPEVYLNHHQTGKYGLKG